MLELILPKDYQPAIDVLETEIAIKKIKDYFQVALSKNLGLTRVSAPLFVDPDSGLNDNLNGVERPVSFDIPATGGTGEVVQSLAKWKRYALGRYGFRSGKGLVTDMNAIRRDEALDNLHSVYVDQWDWEKVITPEERTEETLKQAVLNIVDAIYYTQQIICAKYDVLTPFVSRDVSFVTAQQLLDLYPECDPKEREYRYVKQHPTTFVIGIGGKLSDGKPHDWRAPDYDDWSINGDILFYNPLLDCAFEISSMGVRVDAEALDRQLTLAGCENRRTLPFHKMLLESKLPQTIGGGIGQSRLCMLLLNKAHIGEVQSSLWDAETLALCEHAGVTLL